MDPASSSAAGQRRSVVRRHPVAVAAVLGILALAIGLPTLARLGAERGLAGLLGVPVRIVAVWWNPFTGLASARGVSIGSGEERIAVRSVSAVVDALALWRGGDVAVARLALDGPDAAVSIDEQHRVTIAALGSTASAGAMPRVVVHDVEISDGRLLVRHPAGGAVRTSTLHISHLHANDIDLESTPSGVRLTASGRLDGSIDGAPLEGDMQLALASDDLKIAGTLAVSGMSVNRDVLPLPPELTDFTATVDARAQLDLSGQPLGGTLRFGLTLADARLAATGGMEVSAKKASLPEVRVDVSARSVDLGAVTIDAPAVLAAIDAEPIAVPSPSTAGAGEQAWAVRSGAVQVRGGRIDARRGDAALALMLDSARWDGMRPGRRSGFAATLRAESGGVISLDGMLGVDPLQAEIDVRLDDLSLPPLAPLAREVPLRLSRGTADGTLHVDYARRRRSVEGQLQAHDVHTAPPDAAQPSEVMAVHSADVRFSIAAEPAPAIDVSLLKLDYPYVMVQRQAIGVFPYSLIAGGEGTPARAAAPPADAPPRLSIQRLEIEGGKIELVDATQQPPYWTSLTDVSAVAEEILPAEGTVARFEATGKQDELSPLQISGTLTADGPVVRLAMQDVLLESMNTYMSPMLGYDFTAGRVSVTATAAPAPPLIESTVEVILRGVDLLQTGHDAIQQQSGVPLPIALELIANRSGEIRLTLPFFVDLKARSVELGSVIWQGVRRAIIGALTSPLRLLGSLFGTRGAPHAFAIDPIPFRSGSAALDDTGKARVAEIGRILQAHRSLLLVLMPQITDDDVREVGPERAVKLAAERNAAVRDAFVDGADLAADRILPVEWKPSTRAEATGRPGVYVELQDAG